jgi:hypothetical protein
VIRTAQPIYEETTNASMLVYGATEPALVAGLEYVWRVQARDVEGMDLFINRGYSEVRSFTFGDACGLPMGLQAEALAPGRARLSWEPQAGQNTFFLRYREQVWTC